MKTLAIVLMIMAIAMVAFLMLAFFYIDLSGHSSFHYDILKENSLVGKVKVDKYVTEVKIVYKSTTELFDTLAYPVINEKLSLSGRNMMPLKFVKEAEGTKGQKRITLLTQDKDKTDFLFLEHPSFITLKAFETGKKTFIFDPADIMLYLPIMERYNFWKKGTQSFEVMIPTNLALAPMRDKIKIKYVDDEYIRVMGQKLEAESFTVTAKSLPAVKFYVAKYTHRILALDIEERSTRFVLADFVESPEKRIEPIIDRVVAFTDKFVKKIISLKRARETSDFSKKEILKDTETIIQSEPAPQTKVQGAETSFKSGNLTLSGKIWIPEGPGPFPAVIIVQNDGPVTKGEKMLLESLSEALAQSNFSVILPDYPGQGKSPKSPTGLEDEKKIQTIISASEHIAQENLVDKKSIILIGHKGGGYIALKAAEKIPSVQTCIVVGVPPALTNMDFYKKTTIETIQVELAEEGWGPFDENFMRTIRGIVDKHLSDVRGSTDDFAFFMGIKVPLKAYKDFIERDSYKAIISCEKPVLLIFGKDEKGIDSSLVKGLGKELRDKNNASEIVLLNDMGSYAGKIENKNNNWIFSLNPEVLNLAKEWILKNGIYKEKVLTEVPDEANKP